MTSVLLREEGKGFPGDDVSVQHGRRADQLVTRNYEARRGRSMPFAMRRAPDTPDRNTLARSVSRSTRGDGAAGRAALHCGRRR